MDRRNWSTTGEFVRRTDEIGQLTGEFVRRTDEIGQLTGEFVRRTDEIGQLTGEFVRRTDEIGQLTGCMQHNRHHHRLSMALAILHSTNSVGEGSAAMEVMSGAGAYEMAGRQEVVQ
jgi:HAMP domain-containing protein